MPLNIDWKQILLHLFNFVLLFAILFFLLYSPIKKFMDKRVKYYKDMDEEANKTKEDAEEMKKLYEEKLSAADEEIAAKKKEAEDFVADLKISSEKKAKEDAQAILERARADGEAEKRKIVDGAQDEIVGLVADACKKALASDPSDVMDGFLEKVNEDRHD